MTKSEALQEVQALSKGITHDAAQLLDLLGTGAVHLPIGDSGNYVVAGALGMLRAVLPPAAGSASPAAAGLTDERIKELAQGVYHSDYQDDPHGYDIEIARRIEREVLAHAGVAEQRPAGALTPDGRVVKRSDNFTTEPWVSKGYRPLYLAAQSSDDVRNAARYRYLRDPETDVSLVLDKRTGWVPPDETFPGIGGYHTYEYRAGDELDAAIDAAMAAAPAAAQGVGDAGGDRG